MATKKVSATTAKQSAARTSSPRPQAFGTLYIETSAVLRMMLEGDQTLRTSIRQASRLVTSALTLVEADRGVRRAVAAGRLTAKDARTVSRWLSAFAKTCEIIALDESVLHRVQQTFPREPVRTLDALHLTSAQAWAEGVEPVVMVSHDTRVRDNARAWGYALLPE